MQEPEARRRTCGAAIWRIGEAGRFPAKYALTRAGPAGSPSLNSLNSLLPRARRWSHRRCRQRNHRQTAVGLPGITAAVSSFRRILKTVFPIDC